MYYMYGPYYSLPTTYLPRCQAIKILVLYSHLEARFAQAHYELDTVLS